MFNKTTITARLTFLVGGLLLLLAITGAIGIRGLSSAGSHYEDDTNAMIHLVDTLDALYQRRTSIQQAMAASSMSESEAPYKQADKVVSDLNSTWSQYLATASDDEKPLAEKFDQAWKTYLDSSAKTIALGKGGDYEKAIDNMKGDAAQKFTTTRQSLLNLIAQKKQNVETTRRANAIANTSMLILLLLGVVIGGGASWKIVSSIIQPLQHLQTVMGEVEKNADFTRRATTTQMDELGQTARSFNSLLETLQGALRQLADNVNQTSVTAQSLSASSSQAALSASQQSEAASAMSATVEQVTVSISHESDSARTALELSRKSGELSEHGGTTIHNAASEMTEIANAVRQTSVTIDNLGKQSDQISSVVQVIKDVAEQTNLLALNAAIEAARAGEQGRGFAVVADEVRKLAERTTQATVEITQMISAIQSSAHSAVTGMNAAVTRVDSGAALAQQAGVAINEIKEGSQQVVRVVGDISSALNEQTSASNDIARHVEKVAAMSEESSAVAQQTAQSASQLEQLTHDMRTLVNRFKI